MSGVTHPRFEDHRRGTQRVVHLAAEEDLAQVHEDMLVERAAGAILGLDMRDVEDEVILKPERVLARMVLGRAHLGGQTCVRQLRRRVAQGRIRGPLRVRVAGPCSCSGSSERTTLRNVRARLVSDVMGDVVVRLGLEAFNAKGAVLGDTNVARKAAQGTLERLDDAVRLPLANVFGEELRVGGDGRERFRRVAEDVGDKVLVLQFPLIVVKVGVLECNDGVVLEEGEDLREILEQAAGGRVWVAVSVSAQNQRAVLGEDGDLASISVEQIVVRQIINELAGVGICGRVHMGVTIQDVEGVDFVEAARLDSPACRVQMVRGESEMPGVRPVRMTCKEGKVRTVCARRTPCGCAGCC